MLPRWQPWATLVICLSPRWPPEPIWKINCPATYLRMMYKTYLYGFSERQNTFLVLKFHFQVKIMSKSRWPSNAILKINAICGNPGKRFLQLFSIHILCECVTTPYPYGKRKITVLVYQGLSSFG